MTGSHAHGAGRGHERSLRLALGLTGSFLVVEVIGGVVTGSLALLSDAAHMFTDVTALAIAFAAVRMGARAADRRRTFGYQRLEIMAAAVNAVLLFLVALYILYEAYMRIQAPPEVQSVGMMAIAATGLVVNLIGMRLLYGGKDVSLNVKGAYLEVWSDMIGSVGVLVGGAAIWLTGWTLVDPIVAVGIGLWVLPRSWALLKESTNILLEGVPGNIDTGALRSAIGAVPGVRESHDLHVWAITTGEVSLTAHVVLDATVADAESVLRTIRSRLSEDFGITHVTLQAESESCVEEGGRVHR